MESPIDPTVVIGLPSFMQSISSFQLGRILVGKGQYRRRDQGVYFSINVAKLMVVRSTNSEVMFSLSA